MALKRDATYPGRFVASSTDHPQGAFKNRTSPTAQDGSYLEAQWANDWDGFFARVLNVAGVVPNGTADTGSASQLYDALLAAMPGRILNIQKISSSGSYTKTPGTKKIKAFVLGAGGAGGGAAVTNSSQSSAGKGGNGGAFGWTNFIDVTSISTISCVVGAAGLGITGADGTSGGDTSFGTYLTAPGGQGGALGVAANALTVTSSNDPGLECTGSSISISVRSSRGSGKVVLGTGSGQAYSGAGGSSPYGNGGGSVTNNLGPQPGYGYGAGGGSVVNPFSQSAQAGGAGSGGLIIVWEFA